MLGFDLELGGGPALGVLTSSRAGGTFCFLSVFLGGDSKLE